MQQEKKKKRCITKERRKVCLKNRLFTDAIHDRIYQCHTTSSYGIRFIPVDAWLFLWSQFPIDVV